MKRVQILITLFFVFGLAQNSFTQISQLQQIRIPNKAELEQTNMQISNVPDEKIEEIVKQMEEKGMTVEQVANIARLKGASELQISQLKERIFAYQQKKTTLDTIPKDEKKILEKSKLFSKQTKHFRF